MKQRLSNQFPSWRKVTLNQRLTAGGNFAPRPPFTPGRGDMLENILGSHSGGLGCPRRLVVGAWDTAQHPVIHRTALTTENWASENPKSAKAGKPCPKPSLKMAFPISQFLGSATRDPEISGPLFPSPLSPTYIKTTRGSGFELV